MPQDTMHRAMLMLFVLFYVMFVPSTLHAQKIVSGTVMDAGSKEALPVAHIRIEGFRAGTITNSEGAYNLELPSVPVTIAVSYIGYHTQRVEITEDSPAVVDILLKPNPVLIETVIVTPGNTAERIMRRVIEKKKEWRQGLETFKADAYTRVSLSGNKKIAMIAESISNLYWDHEKGTKETILSTRHTKNLKDKQANVNARWLPNLYDDDIELFGFEMPGVTSSEAFSFYRFELVDQKLMDDRQVFIISVEPKSKLQPSFRGTVMVLDEEYVVLEFDLVPNEAVMFPPPLTEFQFAVKQQFSSFGEDMWLPVDVRVEGDIKLKLSFLLEFPKMTYSQVSRLSNYELNVALPDSLFNKKDVVEVTVSNESVTVKSSQVEKGSGEASTDAENTVAASSVDAGGNNGPTEDGSEVAESAAGTNEKTPVENSSENIAVENAETVAENDAEPEYDAMSVAENSESDIVDNADDEPGPDSEDGGEPAQKVLSSADSLRIAAKRAHEDSLFAAQRRAIPYTIEEETAYADIDSSDTVDKALKPKGVLAKLLDDDDEDAKKKKRKKKDKKPPSKFRTAVSQAMKGVMPYGRHNRVDGYVGGIAYRRTFQDKYRIFSTAGYSSFLKRMNWSLHTERFFKKNRRYSLYLSGQDFSDPKGFSNNYPTLVSSIATLTGNEDYFDYFRNRKVKAGFRFRPKETTLYELAFNAERHSSLTAHKYDTLAGTGGMSRMNPSVNDGYLYSGELTFTKGEKHNPLGVAGVKGIAVTLEQGWLDAQDDMSPFTSVRLGVDWNFETLLVRRLFPMTLDIRLDASASAGDMPVQRFGTIDTRFMAWAPYGVFKSIGDRPLVGEHHAALFMEHNFRTVPFEMIGLRWLAKKNVGIIAHCAAGKSWISAKRLRELAWKPRYFDYPVSEGGFALNGVLGIGRIDFTKCFNSSDYAVSFNLARLF